MFLCLLSWDSVLARWSPQILDISTCISSSSNCSFLLIPLDCEKFFLSRHTSRNSAAEGKEKVCPTDAENLISVLWYQIKSQRQRFWWSRKECFYCFVRQRVTQQVPTLKNYVPAWEDLMSSFIVLSTRVLPGGSEVKASACNTGDLGWIPGSRRKWQPTLVFWLGESYGQRSLVDGYSPRGCKESDTTEWLHFHFIAMVQRRGCWIRLECVQSLYSYYLSTGILQIKPLWLSRM